MLTELLICMGCLQFKHFVIDWLWQPPFEWKNKGTYGHAGGIVHSGKNAIGTAACFLPFASWLTVGAVLILDFLVHYHVDWAKMNINRAMGWGAMTNNEFWWMTGLDQWLRQMTYLCLLALAFWMQQYH